MFLAAQLSRVQYAVDAAVHVGETAGFARRAAPRAATLMATKRAAGFFASGVGPAETRDVGAAAQLVACSSSELGRHKSRERECSNLGETTTLLPAGRHVLQDLPTWTGCVFKEC